MKKGEGYTDSFICAINDLLYGKENYISNDIVLEEMNRRFGGEIDEQEAKEMGGIANAMRKDYSENIKKAKHIISKCLKEHGFKFDDKKDPQNKKKRLYRYPLNLNFNPGEELLKTSKSLKLSELMNLINSSSGLFPRSWLANFRIQLNKEIYPEDQNHIIQFDTNVQLKNIELVPKIYETIKKKQVISFFYHPFGRKGFWVTMSPKFLKEYNNRWFVLGGTKSFNNNQYAVDRIEGVLNVRSDLTYKDNEIDYAKFYENIVGVSNDCETRKVVLEVEDGKVIGYLKTKPIISSQIIEGNRVIFPSVALNYEFVTRILEYADRVKVIEPIELGKQLIKRVNNMEKRLKSFDNE